jgi:hypothetical protein
MKDNVRTKLELSESGLSTPKRRYKRRKPLKKKEQVQEPKIQEVSNIEAVPIEERNIIFKPNAGPQTEFLAAGER